MSTGSPSTASKSTGSASLRENADDPLQPGELAVRDGDAFAKAGGAEPLALEKGVEHVALLQAGDARRPRRELLEKLLLGLGSQRRNHRLGADEIS